MAYLDCQDDWFDQLIQPFAEETLPVQPDFVTENEIKVNIPENLDLKVMDSKIWEEYSQRCIACGRCNFVCPTCTCFTMQDIFYKDNAKTGERRRVWASCHVDGYTDMAGGHKFRDNNGQRMRFKVLHKVYDYNKRFGYHMCTGCGRCDDICPEYISFSTCVNRLADAMQEVTK
jgi:anaerobic sulfite reductase subunit A